MNRFPRLAPLALCASLLAGAALAWDPAPQDTPAAPAAAPDSAHSEHGHRGHRGGPRPGAGAQVAEELQLDDSQKQAVKQIFADTHTQREAIMKSSAAPDEKHKQMLALHDGVREKMAKVLSAEQLQRFDAMHARHMERMQRHMERHGSHGDHGTPPPDAGTDDEESPADAE